MIDQVAAIIASLILIGLGIFQFALIAKAPLGNYAWGGANLILPYKLRIASIISVVLYILFIFIILEKAELISIISQPQIINISTWLLTAYFAFGILLNSISRSKPERLVMTPVALLLTLLSLILVF